MKLIRDIGVSLITIVVFLAIAEAGLRVAGMKYDGSFYHLDRELGYTLRPNAEGWNVKEHERFVRISSQGMRDRVHDTERPADVIRIAVIGDSLTEAKQVDAEAAYWAVMERELNRRVAGRPQKVEVLNFGVAGYGLAQDYLVIRDRIWQYDPQVVLLSGTMGAFIMHSIRKFGSRSDEGPVPFFEVRDGNLVLDEATAKERTHFVPTSHMRDLFANAMNESRLLALTNAALRKLSAETTVLAGKQATPADGKDNLDEALRGPATPDLAAAWNVSEQLISECRSAAEQHHAEFWLITLDMPEQVDPEAANRSAFEHRLGISDVFLADRLMAQFAERQGIRHAALAPKMLAFSEAHNMVLHGFSNTPRNSGHWNELGHRVAGKLIAQELFNCSAVLGGGNSARSCDSGSKQP